MGREGELVRSPHYLSSSFYFPRNLLVGADGVRGLRPAEFALGLFPQPSPQPLFSPRLPALPRYFLLEFVYAVATGLKAHLCLLICLPFPPRLQMPSTINAVDLDFELDDALLLQYYNDNEART